MHDMASMCCAWQGKAGGGQCEQGRPGHGHTCIYMYMIGYYI